MDGQTLVNLEIFSNNFDGGSSGKGCGFHLCSIPLNFVKSYIAKIIFLYSSLYGRYLI